MSLEGYDGGHKKMDDGKWKRENGNCALSG
jgi:hypothetical protein